MKRRLSPFAVAAIVGVLALIGLLAYGLSTNEPDRGIEQALARGERPPAPKLALDRLEGDGRGSLAELRGKVVVLNVWASWCGPCRDESPLLQRWHARMRRGGGAVLGVNVLDVTSDAIDFAREYGLTYPMLRDPDGASLKPLGVVVYPETFVVDRRGRIAAVRRGVVDEEFMREKVAPLLERS
jgi:cytochrome c biogenesis protein CcmG, thiol:disulfide interchange protein DsbE